VQLKDGSNARCDRAFKINQITQMDLVQIYAAGVCRVINYVISMPIISRPERAHGGGVTIAVQAMCSRISGRACVYEITKFGGRGISATTINAKWGKCEQHKVQVRIVFASFVCTIGHMRRFY